MDDTAQDRHGESPLPSNWGRWGSDDELGTLNLVTPQVAARAAAEVNTGRSVSLARPIDPAPVAEAPFTSPAAPNAAVRQAMLYTGIPPMGMAEVLIMTPHDPGLTHLDAVAHMPVDGHIYPGRDVSEAVTADGVQYGSTTAFARGLVTRAVLLDLAPGDRLPPGHPITAADLDEAERSHAVRIEPGDALVMRAGCTVSWDASTPSPGLTVDAVNWMHSRDIALFGGDIGDAFPPLDAALPMPLHMVGLARLGMPLIDNLAVDELASTCAELGRFTFMLAVAPPRLKAATGVPVNPLAIF